MFERFTDRARKVMAMANQAASYAGLDHVGAEHVLLAIAAEGAGVGARALQHLGVDLQALRQRIDTQPKGVHGFSITGRLQPTLDAQNVTLRAIDESRALGHRYVGSEHLLLGLIQAGGTFVAQVLAELGVAYEAARGAIDEIINANPGRTPANEAPPSQLNTVNAYDPIDPRIWRVLARANDEAKRFQRRVVGVEHLLVGLLVCAPEIACRHLEFFGTNLETLRKSLERLNNAERKACAQPPVEGSLTTAAARVFRSAVSLARLARHDQIEPLHLLLAILRWRDGVAEQALTDSGFDTLRAELFIKMIFARGS